MKKQKFNIDLVVYPVTIHFFIGHNDGEFRSELINTISSNCLEDLDKDPAILSFDDLAIDGRTIATTQANIILVRLRRHIGSPTDHGVVAHEVFHAVAYCLHRCGLTFKINKSDEAYAYLMSYIIEQFYKKLKK